MNLLALLMANGAVLTPAQNPDYIETAWVVQPDTAQIGERGVRDGDYILKHRLLPPSLAQLQDDVVDGKSGKILAKAGEQLFGLLTSGAPVFCVNRVPKQNAARSLLLGSGNLQRCMIDSDADGRLDAHFNAGSAIPGLPNFIRKRPKKPNVASGGRYVMIDPKLDNQNYYVGIRYEGRAAIIDKGSVPTFGVRFGTAGNEGSLTYDTVPKERIMPFEVQMLGARFDVLSITGEVIEVRVNAAMPEQNFGVTQTVRYY